MSNIINEVKSAPETFTNWDKCMSKTYCKWPAIAGIVIGSLILLSVLFCLIQCICCGVSCAKMLCCCCNGCDGCCGKGKSGRRDRDDRPTRFKDDYQQMPPAPNPYAGYIPPSAMATSYRGMPQTATFDDHKSNADSLPAMPSWDTATTRRVEDHSIPEPRKDDMEMGHMNRPTHGGYDQVPLSPTTPHGAPSGYYSQQPSHHHQSDLGTQRMSPQPYATGAIPSSPAPAYTSTYEPQYNDYTQSRTQTFSPPPAGTMPYNSNSNSSYNYNSYSARPPSFLQVGRKPVPGSMREV